MKVRFTINEVPQSVNHLYFRTRWGGQVINKKGKAFKQKVADAVNSIGFDDWINTLYHSRLIVKFTIYFDNNRKRDLDNCMKIMWDSLNQVLFEDDSQIDEYTVIRAHDKDRPRVEIEVENIC
jgi:Holliday junction resolvase RusA-like endonuclease